MPPLNEHDLCGKSINDLTRSEWCREFERLQRNRLIIGALRYGLMGKPGKPKYDRVNCMRRRLDQYCRTGNLEHLVDVANIAMLEFVEGDHPLQHFAAGDDTQHSKVREVKP
jgi:hypothetical protein